MSDEFQIAMRWTAVEVDGAPAVQVEVGRVFHGESEPRGEVWCGLFVDPKNFAASMSDAMRAAQAVWPTVFPKRQVH